MFSVINVILCLPFIYLAFHIIQIIRSERKVNVGVLYEALCIILLAMIFVLLPNKNIPQEERKIEYAKNHSEIVKIISSSVNDNTEDDFVFSIAEQLNDNGYKANVKINSILSIENENKPFVCEYIDNPESNITAFSEVNEISASKGRNNYSLFIFATNDSNQLVEEIINNFNFEQILKKINSVEVFTLDDYVVLKFETSKELNDIVLLII